MSHPLPPRKLSIPAAFAFALLACTPPGELSAEPPAAQVVADAPSGPALDSRFELEVLGKPEGLAACDLDGDGRDELVVLSRSPGRLTLFSELPTEWNLRPQSRDIEVGDYALGPVILGAGGPAPHIAYASRSTLALSILDPRAPEKAAHFQLRSAPRALAAAPRSRAGDEGVMVATAGGALLFWNGTGLPRRRAIDEHQVSALLAVDDGSAVVVADRGLRTLALYPTGDSQGSAGVLRRDLAGLPRALLALDLDQSGDDELVVAGGDRQLWIFGYEDENGPRGWFGPTVPRTLDLDAIPLGLARGDFSGAGRDDLVALCFGQLSYSVLSAGEPPGGPLNEFLRGYAGQSPWNLATGDFDGDGRSDLCFANRDARRVSLIFGGPTGGLRVAHKIPTGRAPHSLALLQSPDTAARSLAVIHSLEDTWSVYSPGPEGWISSARFSAGPGANHIRALDFNQSGNEVLVWTSTSAAGAQLVFAHPPARPNPLQLPTPFRVGTSAADLVVCDLDGDGLRELVVCDENARSLRWVRFGWDDAAARITTLVSTLELAAAPMAAVVLPRGGFESLAVACASATSGSGLVFVVAGADGLEVVDSVLTPGLPLDLAAADFDGDGQPDLAVLSRPSASSSVGNVQLWLRDEGWQLKASHPTGQRPYAVAAGDWSGNGRAEVLVSAQNSHNLGLWRVPMEAGRLLLERQADLGAGLGPLALLLGDLDGDGLLEALVASAFSDEITVIRRGR
ncbi:MAG TPA: VCBS repeat-containing protein [Planctomycetes bacterium]|nr:VCBS repeat-containing protein [Planctomycetota bacterium]